MSSSSSPATPARRRTVLGILVLLAAGALALVVVWQLTGAATSGSSGTPTSQPGASSGSTTGTEPSTEVGSRRFPELARLARRQPGAASAIGDVDAPVVMIEYADFQCPFCRKFAQDTQPTLVEKYVEKGILRLEWRHFPIFGGESVNAAQAAWAAGQQGKFWAYHEALFSHAPARQNRNSGAFSDENLVQLAKKVGIPDIDRFRSDMNSQAAAEAVSRDRQEGYRIGVTSTPAFLINGRPVLGARPTEVFEQVIQKAREAAAARESGAGTGSGAEPAPRGGKGAGK